MGEEAIRIKATFKNLIDIYNATSSLLLDAGSIMKKHGYKHMQGNAIGTATSKNIDYPSEWFPWYAGRYFFKEGKSSIIKAIGILFADPYDEPLDPVILLATFNMTQSNFKRYGGSIQPHVWLELADKKAMKSVISISENKKFRIKRTKIMAIPLEEVKEQAMLEKTVIKLIDMEL